jgi:hypothetical protein
MKTVKEAIRDVLNDIKTKQTIFGAKKDPEEIDKAVNRIVLLIETALRHERIKYG